MADTHGQRLIDAYCTYQTGRSFSPATIRRRRGTLRRFTTFLAPMPLGEATTDALEEWLRGHHAPRTRHAYRSDLMAFYRWAMKRGQVTADPTSITDPIRLPRALPRPVAAELVPTLIALADCEPLRLSIALAAYAGLRRAEIAALSSGDVSLSSRPPMLAVREGKGRKDRLVPVHPELARLLAQRRPSGPVVGWVADTVGRRVADHLRACGVDATCHQLRHSFGTELARLTGGNLWLVAGLMGHEDISTTQGYVGWDGGESAGIVAQMFATGPRLDPAC